MINRGRLELATSPIMSSTRENHADVNIENISTHIDMLFQSNGTLKYLRNNKIMPNFSRDVTIVAFYQLSFTLRLQCALYFRVCSISRPFFVLLILMNQSFQSPHPGESMISLLYNSATVQQRVFVQNSKSYYLSTFLSICQHEKKKRS